MERLLHCKVCQETVTRPKLLPCNHTVCLKHLINKGQASCPVCNVKILLPEEGPEYLPTDVQALKLQALMTLTETDMKCGRCDQFRNASTEIFCEECNFFLCSNCYKIHTNLEEGHTSIYESDVIIKCLVHQKIFTEVCFLCDKLCCKICLDECAYHVVEKINDSVISEEYKKNDIAAVTDKIKDEVTWREDTKNTNLLLQHQVTKIHELRRVIRDHADKLTTEVNRRKEDLLQELNTYEIELLKRQTEISTSDVKLWEFQSLAEAMDAASSKGDFYENVASSILMKRMSSMRPKMVSQFTEQDLHFHPFKNLRVGTLAFGRRVYEEYKVDDQKAERISGIYDQLSAGAPEIFDIRNDTSSIEPVAGANLTSRDHPQETLIQGHDIIYLPTGQLAVTDNGISKVVIYDEHTSVVCDSSGKAQFKCPCSLAYHPGLQAVMVADSMTSSIQLLNPETLHLTDEIPLQEDCTGLAVFRNGDFVTSQCGMLGKHTVSVYTQSGQLKNTWGTRGSRNSEFCYPWYVAVDHHDRVLVADTSNHCLKIFDANGKFLRRFGDPIQMCMLHGICVDEKDNIYVAHGEESLHTNCISQWTSQGELITKLIEIDSRGREAQSIGEVISVATQGGQLAMLGLNAVQKYTMLADGTQTYCIPVDCTQ